MKLVYALLFTVAVALPLVSRAEPENVLTTSYSETMPSSVRLSILGGYGVMKPSRYENIDNKDNNSGSIAALLGFGRGAVSIEGGVSYSLFATTVESTDSEGGKHKLLVNSQYVGVPVWLKYNYIEKPLATFFVKAGAAPLFLMGQTPNNATDDTGAKASLGLAGTDVLAIAGIGGTAPISSSMAFLIDISGYYGVTSPIEGAHHQGLNVGLGISYDL